MDHCKTRGMEGKYPSQRMIRDYANTLRKQPIPIAEAALAP